MSQKKEDIVNLSNSGFCFKETKNKECVDDEEIEKENNNLFSDIELMNVEESLEFWKKDIDVSEIIKICDDLESSDEDVEKQMRKENFSITKKVSNAEINTLPFEEVEMTTEMRTQTE